MLFKYSCLLYILKIKSFKSKTNINNKWKGQQIQTLEVYVSCEILMKTNIKKMMMMMNQVNFSFVVVRFGALSDNKCLALDLSRWPFASLIVI